MFVSITDPGTRKRKVHILAKPLISIGRAQGNDIVLPDPMVDPTHANLLKTGDELQVNIIDRSSELYLNGKRVRSARLKAGDRLLVGRYELEINDGEPSKPAGHADPTQQLDALARLVSFSERLMADTTPDQLFQALLQSVMELTQAEKGFVIFFQDGEKHLAAAHNVSDEALDLSRVSDSIIDSVIGSREPLIVSNAVRDTRFGKSKSVVDLRLSSVMCVPLIYRTDMLGALYLGNDSVRDLFTDSDLETLRVFAAQASLIVHTALMLNELKVSNRNLRDQLRKVSQGDMIGSSAAMKSVFRVLRRVAPTDISVLVLGETGTGKELVAREIHRLSPRARKAFISINCGAIPENLLESELFGHTKGAFTGAVTDKIGKFQAAAGGTIFLDEIGEMPAALQVKLLRILQERVVERIGDLRPEPLDIRVIAATNKNPEDEIAEGRFREDLYYRLNEVSVELPALRDRGEDIIQLGQYFLNRYATQYESKVRGFNNAASKAMKQYYWPGNVRQLENRLKRAVIMCDRAQLRPEDLGLAPGDKRHIQTLEDAVEEFKKSYIRQVLDMNNWNKAQTARDLGVDPRTVFRHLEKAEDS